MTDARRGAFIARSLLSWYDRRQRDLPWRREPSPYRTLVSEFMLQQTVVAAVVPYFGRFMARLPDLQALARASEDEVLALWSGLGYYARARNLHRAARAVADQHGGALPDEEEKLRALPGIGPYTAAAVAAIAFGKRTLPLDGNAARVIARLEGVVEAIDSAPARARLRQLGRPWVPARRPGDFAQAVMELGATVCVPRTPSCRQCPLVAACVAHQRSLVALIPRKAVRAPKQVVRLAALRLRRRGEVFLMRRQTGLLAGTWMLPARAVTAGEPDDRIARGLTRDVGIVAGRLTRAGCIRHLFTHLDVSVTVFDALPLRPRAHGGLDAAAQSCWAHESRLDELAVSSFLRKQLRLRRDNAAQPE